MATLTSKTDKEIGAIIRAYVQDIDVDSVSVKAARLHVASKLGVSIDEKSERKRLKQILIKIVTGIAPQVAATEPEPPKIKLKSERPQEVQLAAGPAVPSATPASAASSAAAPAPAQLSEEDIMEIARKRRYHTLSPQLSRVCGGRTVASRGMVLRYLWEYIRAHGLQDTQQKIMLNLDGPMRAVAPADWPAAISVRKLTGMFGAHLSEYTGSPPADEIQAIREKPPKPPGRKRATDDGSSVAGSEASSSARGQKRPRDDTAAAAAAGLPPGTKLLKRPRANKYHKLSEALRGLLPPDKADRSIASRQQVVKWIWDYVKERGLQCQEQKTRVTLDAKMQRVMGPGDDKGTMHMFHLAKHIGQHLSPYDGPIPVEDQVEYDRAMQAVDDQEAEMKAMGIDPAAARKAARTGAADTAGAGAAATPATPALYVFDDAVTAVLGCRVATRKQMLGALSAYLQDNKLFSPDGTVSPNTPLARILGASSSVPLLSLVGALESHVTVVPAGCKHSSASGLQDATGFSGNKHKSKIAASLRAALPSSSAGPAGQGGRAAGPSVGGGAGVFDAASGGESSGDSGAEASDASINA